MFRTIASAHNLILKDNLILYPAIIISFILNLAAESVTTKPNPVIFALLLASWLANLLIMLLAIHFGLTVLKDRNPNFTLILKSSLIDALPSVFWSGLFGVTGMICLVATKKSPLAIIYALAAIVLVSITQILPVIVVISRKVLTGVLPLINELLIKKSRLFLRILFAVFIISTFQLSIVAMLRVLSVKLFFLTPIIQGYANVLLTYAMLLLYLNQESKITDNKV